MSEVQINPNWNPEEAAEEETLDLNYKVNNNNSDYRTEDKATTEDDASTASKNLLLLILRRRKRSHFNHQPNQQDRPARPPNRF